MSRPKFLFTSKRLGFRQIADTDFDALMELDMDPAVRAQFPEGILTREQIKERIAENKQSFQKNGFGDFAAVDLETGQFVGRAGFALFEGGEIEVGYVLLRQFWGCGLAQETLRALLKWARDNLEIPRIVAYAPKQHTASFNVMKKAGMQYFKTAKTRSVECDYYEYRLQFVRIGAGLESKPIRVERLQQVLFSPFRSSLAERHVWSGKQILFKLGFGRHETNVSSYRKQPFRTTESDRSKGRLTAISGR